ncbi:hypothetical protein D3C71_1646170 [compost metagenome]
MNSRKRTEETGAGIGRYGNNGNLVGLPAERHPALDGRAFIKQHVAHREIGVDAREYVGAHLLGFGAGAEANHARDALAFGFDLVHQADSQLGRVVPHDQG